MCYDAVRGVQLLGWTGLQGDGQILQGSCAVFDEFNRIELEVVNNRFKDLQEIDEDRTSEALRQADHINSTDRSSQRSCWLRCD